MTDVCYYCGNQISKGADCRWYADTYADPNGYCPDSPTDRHTTRP